MIYERYRHKKESGIILEKNKRRVGGIYEQKAAEFLQENGLVILERNFRCRQGEVDLIAKDGDYTVFVEVKYRRGRSAGDSLAAVHPAKQRAVGRVAVYYLWSHNGNTDCPCRFDVVGIDGKEIHWIKNAFEYVSGL